MKGFKRVVGEKKKVLQKFGVAKLLCPPPGYATGLSQFAFHNTQDWEWYAYLYQVIMLKKFWQKFTLSKQCPWTFNAAKSWENNVNKLQGVQEKKCFFTVQYNPFLAYITIRDLQSPLNAMRVYSHSYRLVIFCTTNSSRVLAWEKWQTFETS